MPSPSPETSTAINFVPIPAESWVDIAHKYGVDFLIGIVFLGFFIYFFWWYVTNTNAKIESKFEMIAGIPKSITDGFSDIKERLGTLICDSNSHKDCTKDNFFYIKSTCDKCSNTVNSIDSDVDRILNYLNDIAQENKNTAEKVKYIMESVLRIHDKRMTGGGNDDGK